MEKNLITEIHRISELIGIKNKITLNEGVLSSLFANVVESELIAILKAEIKNAMKEGIEVVSKNGVLTKSVKDAAEAAVKIKSGLPSLTAKQKSALRIELIKLGKEEAEKVAKKGAQKASKEAAEKAAKEAAEKAAKETGERSVNVTVTNTVKQKSRNLTKIGGVSKKTANGGTKRLTATAEDLAAANGKGLTKVVQIGGVDYVMELAKKGWSFKQMIKSSAVKWGLGLLAAGLIVWWILATMGDIVPKDITPVPPKPEDIDDDGDGDGNVYTTPGDPYQYKVVDCVWFTKSLEQRGKIISDWTSLANNQKAIDILDGRFPDARKNCGGNSSTNTNTNTNTDNNTLTPSGTTLNQQYGTEPMANAQAEVQTTNDDINNY